MRPWSRWASGAAVVVAVLAAVHGVATAASWRPQFGVEVGPSLGRMAPRDGLDREEHWELGGSAGLITRWDLGPAWSLEVAPGWEQPRTRGTGALDATITLGGSSSSFHSEYEYRYRFDRIVTPVRAVFRPGGSAWSMEGGFAAAWLARAGRTFELTLLEETTPTPFAPSRPRALPSASIFEEFGTADLDDVTRSFHRWDAVAVAGLGWDRAVGAHALRVRLRWLQGLTDIGKGDASVRVHSASATLGVLW